MRSKNGLGSSSCFFGKVLLVFFMENEGSLWFFFKWAEAINRRVCVFNKSEQVLFQKNDMHPLTWGYVLRLLSCVRIKKSKK